MKTLKRCPSCGSEAKLRAAILIVENLENTARTLQQENEQLKNDNVMMQNGKYGVNYYADIALRRLNIIDRMRKENGELRQTLKVAKEALECAQNMDGYDGSPYEKALMQIEQKGGGKG